MARTILEFEYHRNKGVKLTPLPMSFLTGDKNGHEFRIAIVDKNGSVDLTGAKVLGWLISDDQNRTDDITVSMTGSAKGNVASLILSEGCYLRVGRFSLVIKVSIDDELATVFWATGSMLRTRTDTFHDDGKVVSLETLLAKIEKTMEEQGTTANAKALGGIPAESYLLKSSLRTVALSLAASAWTGSGPYTATISRSDVTDKTWISFDLTSGSMSNYSAPIDWETSAGRIALSTAVKPTGTLAGTMILMEVV